MDHQNKRIVTPHSIVSDNLLNSLKGQRVLILENDNSYKEYEEVISLLQEKGVEFEPVFDLYNQEREKLIKKIFEVGNIFFRSTFIRKNSRELRDFLMENRNKLNNIIEFPVGYPQMLYLREGDGFNYFYIDRIGLFRYELNQLRKDKAPWDSWDE